MKKSPTTTTPVVKLEQSGGTTSTSSSTVGGVRPISLIDPTMSSFPRIGQPMGPPPQPPAGYRSIYSNNTPNPIMVLPRINTQTGNPPLLSRKTTTPTVPGTTGATDEKASYDDVLTFTGVDLKEETDNILRENELLGARQSTFASQFPDRSRTQSFLDQRKLTNVVTSIAMQHKLGLSPDVMTYLALATQERIRTLVESMIAAKNHRIHSEHIHHPSVAAVGGSSDGGENLPMYKETISLDVKSQLLAIEKVEREQERKRKEIRAGLKHDKTEDKEDSKDQQAEVTPTTAPKRHKRQKKDTLPTPAIHKLTVDTKNTNMTALSAAGGKTKSWMIDIQPEVPSTSVINGGDTRTSRGSSRSITNTKNFTTAKRGESQQMGGSITTNPYATGQQQPLNGPVPTITVKDALFVLERDRGGGGGAGSGREVLMKGYVKWLR